MNTGVCITCGAADVEVNDDTEQCVDCDKEEKGDVNVPDTNEEVPAE